MRKSHTIEIASHQRSCCAMRKPRPRPCLRYGDGRLSISGELCATARSQPPPHSGTLGLGPPPSTRAPRKSLLVPHPAFGPSAHETSAILRPRRRHRGRYSLGANKPAYQLDPGFLEYLRLSPRAFIGPGARLLEFLFTGPHADDATQEEDMELLHRRCCGLDVHKGWPNC